jgi:two-component system sensor histidine kinase DegS
MHTRIPDGAGFHVEQALEEQHNRRKMGISSMRQRAEVLLQGQFDIESAIGRGTRVAATMPLP